MGYAIEVDEERRRVTVLLSEVVTLDVLTGYVDELTQRGYWEWPQVIDTSGAVAIDLDGPGMIAFAEYVEARAPRGPVVMAAVTRGAKEVAHSLIAASRSVFPGRIERRRVADSVQDAHEWLDSKPPDPEEEQ